MRISFLSCLLVLGYAVTAQPVISSFSPVSAATGATVIITGSGFSTTASNNIVYFGAVRAVVSSSTANSITTTVPAQASHQPITVSVNNKTAISNLAFTVTFPTGSVPLKTASMGAVQPITGLSSYAYGITFADLDGDGKADMIVSTPNDSTISILRNTGTSGSLQYAPKVTYKCGGGGGTIILAQDLDGDGKLDLEVLNTDYSFTTTGSFSTLKNNSTPGTISMTQNTLYVVGVAVSGTDIGDIDGDGKPDIAVSSNYNINLYKNISTTDSILFQFDRTITNGGATRVKIKDMDMDGKPDLVTISSAGYISRYVNTSVGSFSFSAQTYTLTGTNPNSISIDDFDGDGKPDVALGDNGATVSLFLNTTATTGSITFGTKIGYSIVGGAFDLTSGDIDGDGKPDLVAIPVGGTALSVLRNTSSTGAISFERKDFALASALNCAIADIDLDGYPDIVTAGFLTPSSLQWLRNKTILPSVTALSPAIIDNSEPIVIAGNNLTTATSVTFGGISATTFTVTSDSTITATPGLGATGYVAVTTQYGIDSLAGFITRLPKITSFSPASAAAGSSVVISGNYFGANPSDNIVYFGAVRATVTAASQTSLTVTVPPGATYKPISVTYLGQTAYAAKPFILTFTSYYNYNVISSSNFANAVNTIVGVTPWDVVVADLDNDGKADVTTLSGNGGLSILRNTSSTGTISFAAAISKSMPGTTGFELTTADLDGDGRLDLIAANSGYISMYRNTSVSNTISFDTRLDSTVSTGVYNVGAVSVADIDLDGKPDLVIIFNNQVAIYRNKSTMGHIQFDAAIKYTTAAMPSKISVTDFDGDGKPDIVAGTVAAKSIFVFRNTSTPGSVSLIQAAAISVANEIGAMNAADLDGDGKPELVTIGAYNTDMSVFKNNSTVGNISLQFSSNSTTNAGGLLNYPTPGDVNGDGKPDILIGGYYFSLFKNTSSGTVPSFDTRVSNLFSASPYGSAIADIDGDGVPDLVGVNPGNSSVSVLRNKMRLLKITSFTPSVAATGDTVTVTGINFSGTYTPTINGTPATSYIVVSDSVMKIIVGNTTGNGKIAITNNVSSDTAGILYKQGYPQIRSFGTMGGNNVTVFVIGKKFTGTTAVTFGGVSARSFIVTSDTSIQVVVGTGSSGFVKVTNALGSDSMAGFVYLLPPVISSFTPTSAKAGDTILIKGQHFTGTYNIKVGTFQYGTSSFTITDSTLKLILTSGSTTSGKIFVRNIAGIDSMPGFTFIIQPPVLTSFSPSLLYPMDTITLKGKNLSGLTAVRLGDSIAYRFSIPNDSTVLVIAGEGASGKIKVSTAGGSDSLPGLQFVSRPIITSFSPVYGKEGSVITIQGRNFGNTADSNKVFFNGVKANILSANASTITAAVPAGAGLGQIAVIANNMQGISASSFVQTFTSNGSLSFTASSFRKQSLSLSTGQAIKKIVIMDADGDGKKDLVVLNAAAGSFSIFRNATVNKTFSFDTKKDFSVSNSAATIAVGDMNNDGKQDIVITRKISGTYYYMDSIFTFANTGAAGSVSFSKNNFFLSNGSTTLTYLADWNLEGRLGLGMLGSLDGGSSIWRNKTSRGSNDIQLSSDYVYQTSWSTNFNGFDGHDFDGDGKPDMLFAEQDSAYLDFQYNRGYKQSGTSSYINIAYSSPSGSYLYKTASAPKDLLVEDLNGDQKVDVVTANAATNNLSVFKNISPAGTIKLSTNPVLASGKKPIRIAAGDFNGDGKPDIAVLNSTDGTISVYKNNSTADSIIFASPFNYNVGSSIGDMIATDLNGDGKADLVIADTVNNTISILANNFDEPKLLSFSPSKAGAKDSVVLNGYNLTGVTTVQLGGKPVSSFTIKSDSAILVVPGNVVTGTVFISSTGGKDSLPGFTFIPANVAIGSFTPTSAKQLDTVTIRGSAFSTVTAVSFGLTNALSFTILTDSTIKAIVGTGSSGYVKLSGANSSDSLPGFTFIAPIVVIPAPHIISFSPSRAKQGDSVIIKGNAFTSINTVSFGGISALSFTVVNDSTLKAFVATGNSGYIKISGQKGTDSAAGFTFVPVPAITSFTPLTGGNGTIVTINGKHLEKINSVSFGNVSASSFKVISDSVITATVGKGGYGNVRITDSNGADSMGVFGFIGPDIYVSTNSLSFPVANGSYSRPVSYKVSGRYLWDTLEVKVYGGHLQISKRADGDYTSSIKFAPVNNSVDSTFIYVRFKGDNSLTSFDDSIYHYSYSAPVIKTGATGNYCDEIVLFTPEINNIKDSVVCFRDPITLSISNSSTNYSVYRWSSGAGTKNLLIENSGVYSLQVGTSDICLSNPSAPIRFIRNSNPIPTIAITSDTKLVSSTANNYRWFYNNKLLVNESSMSLTPSKIGFYKVETSTDNTCWDASTEVGIVMTTAPLVNDTLKMTIYPNPAASASVFYIVGTLQKVTNVVAKLIIADASGNSIVQSSKFIFFGKEIKIPVSLTAKGTYFVRLDVNGDVKTQTIIIQ